MGGHNAPPCKNLLTSNELDLITFFKTLFHFLRETLNQIFNLCFPNENLLIYFSTFNINQKFTHWGSKSLFICFLNWLFWIDITITWCLIIHSVKSSWLTVSYLSLMIACLKNTIVIADEKFKVYISYSITLIHFW